MHKSHLLLSKVRNLQKGALLAMIGGYYGEEVRQASRALGVSDDSRGLRDASVETVRKLALTCFLRFGPPLDHGGEITRLCADCGTAVASVRVKRTHLCPQCQQARRPSYVHPFGAARAQCSSGRHGVSNDLPRRTQDGVSSA